MLAMMFIAPVAFMLICAARVFLGLQNACNYLVAKMLHCTEWLKALYYYHGA